MKDLTRNQGDAPGFAELLTPKLVTVLRQGYGLPELRADAIAILTVAIVALPLSMAIAGGVLVLRFVGSRFRSDGADNLSEVA